MEEFINMQLTTAAITAGVVTLLLGLVWFLQGIGVLPGSFMSGSEFWALAGGLFVIIGLILIAAGVGRRKAPARQ